MLTFKEFIQPEPVVEEEIKEDKEMLKWTEEQWIQWFSVLKSVLKQTDCRNPRRTELNRAFVSVVFFVVISSKPFAYSSMGLMMPAMSSSESFLNIGAATVAIFSPVEVPPVKEIMGTFGCRHKASPTLFPYP